ENDLKIYRNGLLVNLPSNYPGKGTEDASISLDNPGLNFGEGNGIDGTYTFEIINRFDTGRVTNRIYHDALYALDNGDYILGEHYLRVGDTYEPVPISDYGKEKDPSQTYYFLTKEGDYVIDDGSYVSRLHYVNTGGVYNRVDEQYISTEKAGHGIQFFIKRSFTSLEIDRIKPSGYEVNTHIIYPGVVDGRNVIDATKEYIYGDGRLGQIGERVTLVNKNVRVAWYTDEPGTSDIRYICYEVRLHGDVITSATCINDFKVIEEENYAYYDFLYTSQLAAGVEITFWLRDFAGNEKDVEQRSKFVLDVEITRATISGRDLTEIPENYITNQPHIILEILNEGAVYSSGHFYMPVQVGVPYLTGITYYTRNISGGYSPIPQRPELTGEGNYVRLNVEYALIDVKTYTTIESGIYENYINKLSGIRDRISDNVELTFTITNPLMGEYRRIDNNASSHRHHVKQYSITIDIFAPEIRINRDNYVEVDGAFGNNLYRGTLTIALESGAKGFLCKLNYETNVCTNEIEFMEGYTIPNLASNSGKYSYYTKDAVGNASELYLFEIDNITPWFNFINQSDSLPVSEGGFTNASNIDISVSDNILNDKITLEYQLWSPGATTYGEWIGQSVNTYSFTEQGRYKVRIKDVAGNVSPVRSFIIDRSAPEVKFMTSGDTGTREMYNGEIILSDQHPFSITWNDAVQTGNAAPITKVLVNGVLYKKGDLIPASIPTGEEEEEIIYRYGKTGEFDIVVTDLAGNISRYRKVVRNSNYICLNGQIVNVKAQYMFRGNNITFGIDKEFRFNSNDVVLFAIPMSSSNDTCSFTNYKMLDSRSFYEVRDDYATINNSGESGMKYVLDSSYSSKIELNNSYVYAFVIEREVAEVDLQLPVDRFFFFEDPIGWSIIFALGVLILYSIIRVMFVRRKAKLL
ncbi:TPA: hypothetical protein GXZ34_01235, partial [bacterium]|nr:hypothetical protein [bacterium]